MRKSLLLLLALTTCWLGSVSSNSVLNAANVAGVHEEQTQSYALNLLAKGSVFGQFLSNQLAVANNAQNCDGLRVFNAVQGGCTNSQITWNIPISGDGEALLADYPRVVNTVTNAVVNTVDPNNQPITLPVGQYEIQYRWDVDDECIIPVRVIDNQNPVFTNGTGCGLTYNNTTDADTCISTLGTNQVAIPTGTDNCPGATVTWSITDLYDGVITDTQAANAGGFLPDSIELGLGTTTVTFTITDQAATPRTATCTATITVADDNVPAFVDVNGVAVDTTNAGYPDLVGPNAIGTDTTVCVGTLALDLPMAYDTCAGMVDVSYEILDNTSATIGTGTGDIVDFQFPKGVNTVIARATDGINATQVFSFLVEVVDDEAPIVSGCIESFEVEFFTSNNGIDDCNADVTFPEFLASDNCGNVAFKEWAVFDKDTNVTLAGNVNVFPVNVTLEPDTYVVGFAAQDDAGNTAPFCFARFVVFDDEAPKRIGGAPTQDYTLSLNEADCDTTITIAVPNVGDNSTGCVGSGIQGGFFQYYLLTNTATGDTVTIDTVGNAVNNVSELLSVGQYRVTWTAEDFSGNSTEIESFTVTINDVVDPTITLPTLPFGGGLVDTLYLSNYPNTAVDGGCAVVHTIPAITVSDNCQLSSVTVNRGEYNATNRTVTDTIAIGSNTFTYTVTDTSNNTTSTSATPLEIVLVDDVAPTLNGNFAYANIDEPVALGQCSFTKTWNVRNFFKAADNCPTELDTLYVVMDNDISDNTQPLDTLINARTTSIGSAQTLTVSFNGPDVTHQIIVSAVDKSNNKVTKSFTVRARDTQAPELFYQDTVTVFVNSNDCQSAYAEIIFDDQLVSDNCSSDAYLLDNMTNTVDTKGDTVQGFFSINAPGPFHDIVFTTMDSVTNNVVNKTVVVHVVDSILPGIDLTPIDTIDNDARVCEGTTKVFAPVATDACGIATVQYSINGSAFMNLPQGEIEFPFTFPVGGSEIIWQVTDDNGNVALDTQNVFVQDVEAPQIPVIQDIDLNTTAGNCEQNLTIPFPAVTDNCELDSAYITVSDNNGTVTTGANESDLTISIEPGITYTGMVYASDIYGNRDSIDFQITLDDIEDPTLNCPTAIELNVNGGNCTADTILVDAFDFNPSDNCSNFTLTANDGVQGFDPTASYAFPIGTTTVTLFIEDASGNTESCTFDVNVTNNIASHVFDFPVDTVIETTANECSKRYFWSEPRIVGNNCSGENITYTRNFNPGEDFEIGTTTVVYTFTRTDANGNVLETSTRSFDITVEDNQAPVITQVPTDRTIAVGANCTAVLEYSDIDFQDNCDAQGITVTIADSLRSGSELPVGVYVVNIEVTDESGNSASASFEVTVVDNTAPVLTVPTSTVEICGTTADLSSFVSATDNCEIDELSFSPATLAPGANSVTATATDVSGNSVSRTFNVFANDSAQAEITSAASNFYCVNTAKTFTAAPISAGATGTWSVTPTVNIANPTNSTVNITFANPLTYTVTYTVDAGACGITTASQNITILNDVQANIGPDTIKIADRDDVVINANAVEGTGNAAWSVAEGSAVIADANSATTTATGIENNENVTFRWTIAIEGCMPNFDDVVVTRTDSEEVLEGDLIDIMDNGFTPGGDQNGTWDLTEVINDGNYNNGTVYVYNRFGSVIFESTVSEYANNEWDGTYEGTPVAPGAYYFVIDPMTEGVSVLTGTVTVIR